MNTIYRFKRCCYRHYCFNNRNIPGTQRPGYLFLTIIGKNLFNSCNYFFVKLSIIIVSYNVKYFLEQCLCSVMRATENLACEILVVDNASTDDSLEYLTSKFPSVQFIASPQNLGFGKANNLGLQKASGEYILFLNPDTILPEDCLHKTLDFISTKKNAGAVGIRMLDGSGYFLPESKRSLPTPMASFYKLTGLAGLFPASPVFNRYALGNLNEKQNYEVDVLCGAFFLCRRELLLTLQGFDEDFFMYAEDIDLSYRIQKAGYKNYYFAESCIIHFKGESSSKASTAYVKMFYEAMLLFVKKHYHGKGRLLTLSLKMAIWSRAILSALAAPFRKAAPAKTSSQVILAGSREDTAYAASVLLQAYPHLIIQQKAPEQLICNEQAVIFCLGLLTYKTTVELLQQLSLHNVKWFGKASGSMVGSGHKERQGNWYIVPTYVNTHHEQ